MKKTTSQKLSNRIYHYSAFTATLLGIAGANSQEQIQYTDIDDLSASGSWLNIDMNADGTVDYQIANFAGVSTYGPYDVLLIRGADGTYYNGNAILGFNGGYWRYPFALSENTPISAGATSWIGGNFFQTMNFNNCGYSNSNWCDEFDKYLGLRFSIDKETHYGWARLDVPVDASSGWVLKDIAYHLIPNEKILAGQTTSLGLKDNNLSKIKIVALNKSIGIYDLPVATEYKLYNMAGQELLKGTTENKDYVIEANTLASGIYIVELSDKKSKAVLRKKIAL